MKAKFARFLTATPAVAILGLFISNAAVNQILGQTNLPGSAVEPVGLLTRVSLIGASVTAGYATTNMPGNSSGELCRLNHYFDTAITAPHERAQNLGSPLFFLGAENTGKSQIESALKNKPTLVVGADFLFWFCYGSHLTEEQRLELFDRGLKMLESIPCPLIVGDIPDVSTATNGILSPGEVPALNTMEEANRRLRSWAATRPQVSVLNLASFMLKLGAGQEIVIHGTAVSTNQTRLVLQPDHLHLMPSGCALLTLVALDSLRSTNVDGKVQWNTSELENQAVGAINRQWPDVVTGGTVYNPFNAPVSGVSLSTVPVWLSFLSDVRSDAHGHYSMVWRAKAGAQNPTPETYILARDTDHNWAVLSKASASDTNLEIHLQPGLTLSGTIQAADNALTNATLELALSSETATSVVSSVTIGGKDRGAFAFRGLPQRLSYQITAFAPGFGRALYVLSAEKTQTNLVDLPSMVLKPANLLAAGQILGSDRQPCAGASVAVTDPEQPIRFGVRSDTNGCFLIRGLCDGPLTLRVSWGGTNRNSPPITNVVRVKAGDTNIVVNLQNAR